MPGILLRRPPRTIYIIRTPMKLKFTLLPAACLSMCMLMVQPMLAAGKLTGDREKIEDGGKSARKAKSQSRNNAAVRIYPDLFKRVMHVVAKENEGKEIDFFVFDLEGTLMQHYKMENGDHEKLTNLSRGKYIYRVFSGDEETATGEIEIR
jgi:hypothetical protein